MNYKITTVFLLLVLVGMFVYSTNLRHTGESVNFSESHNTPLDLKCQYLFHGDSTQYAKVVGNKLTCCKMFDGGEGCVPYID